MSVVRAANLSVVPIIILALLGVRTVGADHPFDVLAANDVLDAARRQQTLQLYRYRPLGIGEPTRSLR